jgi:phosphoglycerate kinase
MQTLSQINIQNKRVLIREDFNVPMENAKIMNDQRLQAAIPTIKAALEKNAAVILLSHWGRPTEGSWEEKFSLKPIAEYLSHALSLPVRFEKDYLNGITIQQGEVVLCENVRFNPGEKANDATLSQKMAKLADVFVMDAFATAHRAEASTCGVMAYIPSVAGPLLERELSALSTVMENPKRPLTAIIGGAKVSDKLILLKNLIPKVNNLIIGGGIANTLLAASGIAVGQSLYEPALLDEAREILALAKQSGCHIPLPEDVIVAESMTPDAKTTVKKLNEISPQDKIFDIGPHTAEILTKIIHQSGTILWNGPVGVFEMPPFASGTKAIAEAIATSQAFSVAGGGDTLAAVELFGITDKMSYLSTGGGAFLEYIEGKELPAVKGLG